MRAGGFALLLTLAALGCPRQRGWPQQQEPGLGMPGYEAIMAGTAIDGPTLRALEVAAADFFPAQDAPRACIDTPAAHKFYAVRNGEVIYIAILQDPAYCGRAYPSLDAGVRYAISLDGRILRRLLDGEPDLATGQADAEDGGTDSTLLDGDGGATSIDVSVPPASQVSFPVLADAGGTPSTDAGVPGR